MPLIIRNVAFIVIGLYFFINGLLSGNPVSILIGTGLAAVCCYVVFSGKVHKKFQRNTSVDAKDVDDQQLKDFVERAKLLVRDRKLPDAESAEVVEKPLEALTDGSSDDQ